MLAAFPGSRATDRPTASLRVLREAALGSAWEAGARHFGQRTQLRSCERRLWEAHGKQAHAILVNEPGEEL